MKIFLRSHRVILAIGLTILALVLCMGVFLNLLAPPPGIPEKGRQFRVEKGEGAATLALRLADEGIIRSSFAFHAAARLSGVGSSLKAGSYNLEPGMNLLAVLAAIAKGRQFTVRVTIPEGYTSRMIADLLQTSGIVAKKDFLAAVSDQRLCAELGVPAASLEGYLFPDTYFLSPGEPAGDLARRMVGAFREKLASFPAASALSPEKLRDAIVLASIIEREYRLPRDAPLMASVFANRLAIGMRLQSCATVVYIVTEKLGRPHPDLVTRKDLSIQDPYNTYLHAGLPPGPISNPGMTSLGAVFFPVKTNYFYFRLIDPETGGHRFSRTLDEHVETEAFFVKKPGK
jgi:UPF0755 protein